MKLLRRPSARDWASLRSSSLIACSAGSGNEKTSWVVLRKTIASKAEIFSGSKLARSSLITASKAPVFRPSSAKASLPVAIDAWRKPAVREKTSTLRGAAGLAKASPGTASAIFSAEPGGACS